MAFQTAIPSYSRHVDLIHSSKDAGHERGWYAVLAVPQNEQSVVRHLDVREVESFLPTYETVKLWKNRQRVKVVRPLFPGYLFVHIDTRDRIKVLQCPGVVQVVGNKRGPIPILNTEIEFLRSGFCRNRIEPYSELVVGEEVRIKSGIMQGIQGTLVRRSSGMQFVLTIKLINQHAAIKVDAEDLEPLLPSLNFIGSKWLLNHAREFLDK